ncbi:hypothetical protein WJX73_003754 [Symbiochloris irregularis]|uniref:Glycosyl hydrolase family 32 N-terminal domain-containing protein n=1 Tax=Symbiochloris irregularis TaxID=706552 RepID=A0AAW1NZQ8_9CHLO
MLQVSCRAAHSATAQAAELQQAGLIFPCGRPGSWDEGCVGSPVVRWYRGDNEQRWVMWYSGRATASDPIDSIHPSAGSIGMVVSGDGVQWTRGQADVEVTRGQEKETDVGKVLGPNEDEWWGHDTRHLTVSDVQVFSRDAVGEGVGVYWMYYSGGNFEAADCPAGLQGADSSQIIEGIRTRPGLAMSQDARHWARIEGGHHTGALFDAGKEGSDEWDAAFVGSPQVTGRLDALRMYYHSFDPQKGKWGIGIAESDNGMGWQKRGPIFWGSEQHDFDARGAAAHHVVQDFEARRYVMFYEAVAKDNTRSIGMAVSPTGVDDWECLPEPVLQPAQSEAYDNAEAAWDAQGVGAPCALAMASGQWRLYYAGRAEAGAWGGIGLAITDITNLQELQGVRTAFKRTQPRGLD